MHLLQQFRLWHMMCAMARAHLYPHLKHWRHARKSMPCLIKKASRCAADRMSITAKFFIFPFYQTQRSYEKIVCICLLFYWFSGEEGIIRSSHPRRSIKEGVLKNFIKFTGKHPCQSDFLINLQVLLTSLLLYHLNL